MDLDAIEQRTRAATEGPWDAEKTAECIRITRDHVPALVDRVRELEESVRVHRESITRLDSIKSERGARIVGLEAALAEAVEMRDVNNRLLQRAADRANRAEGQVRAARGTIAALERARENGDTT